MFICILDNFCHIIYTLHINIQILDFASNCFHVFPIELCDMDSLKVGERERDAILSSCLLHSVMAIVCTSTYTKSPLLIFSIFISFHFLHTTHHTTGAELVREFDRTATHLYKENDVSR